MVESESVESDCSVDCTLRMSGYTSQEYTVDDIKMFLKETKNARNIQIDNFFPDVEQFMAKTKQFISDALFSNPEVYRLTKFITKLNTLLGKDSKSKKAARSRQAANVIMQFIFIFILFLIMGDFRVASLNINGARDPMKRAQFQILSHIKRLDVVLLQETHSDAKKCN